MAIQIISCHSPNFTSGRFGYNVEAIVIHIMEGTLAGTDNWFANPKSQVSAHFGIGFNGLIHQYVNEQDCAWHAGRICNPSWQLLKKLPSGKFVNPNYYTIGIEHEGNESSEWTDQMYQSSGELIGDICSRNKLSIDRDHIIGHHEIYSAKTCPGQKVSISRILNIALGNDVRTDTEIAPPKGVLITITKLRIRLGEPSTTAPVSRIVNAGTLLPFAAKIKGEAINGIDRWYTDGNNHFWWEGGVKLT
jgi:N-acetylmuramoyl-L-alanine amidase